MSPPSLDAPHGYRPYNTPISELEFVQRVRRNKPSSLVPLIAWYGAEFNDKVRYTQPDSMQYAPWALAEVARVSLVNGNEFRKDATEKDIWECCRAYAAIRDPELNGSDAASVGRFLLRMSNQFAYQQPIFNDLARTAALFEQTVVTRSPKVLTSGWAQTLLGCSLPEFVGTAILLRASALNNHGSFDMGWLGQPQIAEITQEVSLETLTRAIETHFISSIGEFKQIQRDAESQFGPSDADYRRFSFTPLWSKPAVAQLTDHLIIPVPHLLISKASPLGIYYIGVEKWGSRFAEDVGNLFEEYVGRQLRLISDAVVIPEITYGGGKDRLLSVDWFVIFHDCVLLVEVKSTRPTEPVRRADSSTGRDLVKRLAHSIEQLNRSAAKVRARAPEFSAVPHDRPILGLVVTMEPFHTVNFPFSMSVLPSCDVPFRFCSVLELEQLVTVNDISLGRLLLNFMTDPDHDNAAINGALAGHTVTRNSVLDQGWSCYPWRGNRTNGD